MTVKERHYWKFIKQILFLLNYILFIIKICQMCKIKSHWMFSVVFFMFYICVICDCVCVLKYAIYLIWPRQFSFGPDSSHLAHVFLIWLIPWPEQKMSQRGPWERYYYSINRLSHDLAQILITCVISRDRKGRRHLTVSDLLQHPRLSVPAGMSGCSSLL